MSAVDAAVVEKFTARRKDTLPSFGKVRLASRMMLDRAGRQLRDAEGKSRWSPVGAAKPGGRA